MTSDSPLVSILMPAYNAAGTISRSIYSLLSQTYENWECIIVDDGSSDGTVAVVEAFSDPRIILFRFQFNLGRGSARKKALELAKGKYVTMVDADDWIYPDKIKIQVHFLECNPDCVLHSCGMAIVSPDNDIVAVRSPRFSGFYVFDSLKVLPVFHAPSMFRRDAAVGMTYDTRFLLAQDMDFLRRLLWQKRFYVSNDVLYAYDEINSVSLKKMYRAYYYNSLGYIKFFRCSPFRSLFMAIIEIMKISYIAYKAIVSGRENVLLSRSVPPGKVEFQRFITARECVLNQNVVGQEASGDLK